MNIQHFLVVQPLVKRLANINFSNNSVMFIFNSKYCLTAIEKYGSIKESQDDFVL